MNKKVVLTWTLEGRCQRGRIRELGDELLKGKGEKMGFKSCLDASTMS